MRLLSLSAVCFFSVLLFLAGFQIASAEIAFEPTAIEVSSVRAGSEMTVELVLSRDEYSFDEQVITKLHLGEMADWVTLDQEPTFTVPAEADAFPVEITIAPPRGTKNGRYQGTIFMQHLETYGQTVLPENYYIDVSVEVIGGEARVVPTVCHTPSTILNADMRAVYGSNLNLFRESGELPIGGVLCGEGDEGEVWLGDGKDTTLIYPYAFRSNPARKYERIKLTGEKMLGPWIVGEAHGYDADLLEGLDDTVASRFVLAYVCQLVHGVWKCGCSDTICARSNWNMFPASPSYGMINEAKTAEFMINSAATIANRMKQDFLACLKKGHVPMPAIGGTPMCPYATDASDLVWPDFTETLLTSSFHLEYKPDCDLRTDMLLPFTVHTDWVTIVCPEKEHGCNLSISLPDMDIDTSMSEVEQSEVITKAAARVQAAAIQCQKYEGTIQFQGEGTALCSETLIFDWPSEYGAVDWEVSSLSHDQGDKTFTFEVTTDLGDITCTEQACSKLK